MARLAQAIYKENCRADSSYEAGDPGKCVSDLAFRGGVYTYDLSELLALVSVPNVFSGRSVISLACLLTLVLYAKFSFWLRFVVREGVAKANTHFSLSFELSDPKNNAVAVSLAAYTLALGLVLYGVLGCVEDQAGWHAANTFGWTAIGAVLLLVSQRINDLVLMPGVKNANLLLENNVAVACLEAGSYLSSGLIVMACVTGSSESFWAGLLLVLIFWSITQAQITRGVMKRTHGLIVWCRPGRAPIAGPCPAAGDPRGAAARLPQVHED